MRHALRRRLGTRSCASVVLILSACGTLVVASVTDRLSTDARTSTLSSRFLNRALALRLAPAVELDVFPFGESNRRMLTFEYSLGGGAVDYVEQTVFGKSRQRLLDQRLVGSLRLTEKWGSA